MSWKAHQLRIASARHRAFHTRCESAGRQHSHEARVVTPAWGLRLVHRTCHAALTKEQVIDKQPHTHMHTHPQAHTSPHYSPARDRRACRRSHASAVRSFLKFIPTAGSVACTQVRGSEKEPGGGSMPCLTWSAGSAGTPSAARPTRPRDGPDGRPRCRINVVSPQPTKTDRDTCPAEGTHPHTLALLSPGDTVT